MQNLGLLKVFSGGILWKKLGGGKAVEADKADIMGVTWMKAQLQGQINLVFGSKTGYTISLPGFETRIISSLPLSLSTILVNAIKEMHFSLCYNKLRCWFLVP